jgi:coenzyme F420-reducing hydrogenase delta subunit
VRGNERGLARLTRAKEILNEIGLGGERLDMFFMSGSQGHAFAMAAQTMTERIRKLGPNPLKQAAQQAEAAKLSLAEEQEENGFRGRH